MSEMDKDLLGVYRGDEVSGALQYSVREHNSVATTSSRLEASTVIAGETTLTFSGKISQRQLPGLSPGNGGTRHLPVALKPATFVSIRKSGAPTGTNTAAHSQPQKTFRSADWME